MNDAQIAYAMRLMMERGKLLVEPSGAVSYAAAVKMRFEEPHPRVGCVISGGNINLTRISELLDLA